jgi:hypothetical protein
MDRNRFHLCFSSYDTDHERRGGGGPLPSTRTANKRWEAPFALINKFGGIEVMLSQTMLCFCPFFETRAMSFEARCVHKIMSFEARCVHKIVPSVVDPR